MNRVITLQQLIDAGACVGQVKLFKSRYGKSVRVTIKECVKVALLFHWEWGANALLNKPAWDDFNADKTEAWRVYTSIYMPSQTAYRSAAAAAFARAYNGDKPCKTK